MFNPLSVAKNVPNWVWLGGAAVVALYVIKKGGLQNATAGATETIIKGGGNVIAGAAQGTVIGLGGIVGIPKTNLSLCKQAIMNADNGKASAYCSAGVFARWQYLSAKQRITGHKFTLADVFS